MTGHYYTIRQVASHLQVTKCTVYKLVQEGKLRAVKVGGQWRIPQSALDAMLGQRGNDA